MWAFSGNLYKIFGKAIWVQTIMYQIQFFNKHLNTKKYPRIGGNFYKILERTIQAKLYCPWYNSLINFWTPKNIWAEGGNLYLILEKTIYMILESRQLYGLNTDQNLLEMLEKYKKEPHMFFIKVTQIFLKGQYWSTHIIPDSSFSEIKHELLKEIYKASLRGQYTGIGSIILWEDWSKFCERTIWIKFKPKKMG